jgi:hypothetical protein
MAREIPAPPRAVKRPFFFSENDDGRASRRWSSSSANATRHADGCAGEAMEEPDRRQTMEANWVATAVTIEGAQDLHAEAATAAEVTA